MFIDEELSSLDHYTQTLEYIYNHMAPLVIKTKLEVE